MCHQGRNVLATFSQRRQKHWKYIQAKVQVAAKLSISYHCRQVLMRRSYKPDIDSMGPTAPQAFELLFLQYAQQFRLQCRWNIAHLVQEEGTFVRKLKTSKLLGNRTSEGAFLVAKKLALQQV